MDLTEQMFFSFFEVFISKLPSVRYNLSKTLKNKETKLENRNRRVEKDKEREERNDDDDEVNDYYLLT